MKMLFFLATRCFLAGFAKALSLSDFQTTNFISLTVPVNFPGQFKQQEKIYRVIHIKRKSLIELTSLVNCSFF